MIRWLAPCVLAVVQESPEVALARAVDQPRSQDRIAAARELAGRADVDLERWLTAVRDLEPLGPPPEPGPHREEAWLDVGGAAPEATEILFHAPPAYDPAVTVPLIVALHGSGGDGAQRVRAWQASADDVGAVVLAPTEAGADLGYAYTELRKSRCEAKRASSEQGRRRRVSPGRRRRSKRSCGAFRRGSGGSGLPGR